MNGQLRMLGTVIRLELAQRVRSVSWYVLLGIIAMVVGFVTIVLFVSLGGVQAELGGAIFSTTIFFVLLVTSLVTPALSGGAINGDREAGVLASTQVTQASTTALVLGKVLAAWIASLAFLAVCVPFMVGSVFAGGLRFEVVAISIVVLVIEIGVLSAVGVGVSGLLRKPIMSIVVSYLTIATLSVGTLIAFGVGTIALPEEREVNGVDYVSDPNDEDGELICTETDETYTTTVMRYDRVWWLLAMNPYVIVSDAISPRFSDSGNPDDLFGYIAVGVRYAQLPPNTDACPDSGATSGDRLMESTVPSWFVGLALHLVLATAAVGGAIAANRTPARVLAPGSRIA